MSDALCDGVLRVLEDTKVPLSLDHIHQKVGMSIPISKVVFNINQLCDIGIVTKVGAKYIYTSHLEQLSPPQQVRKVEVPLPVNPPERRTDVSANLSLSPYLLNKTTQGSPRVSSCRNVQRVVSPVAAVRPIIRSRINDQVERRTDVSESLFLSPYLVERTTQGSPRFSSGQIVPRAVSPVAAVWPITRSRINDQVERRTDVSESLSLSPYLVERTTQGSPRTSSGQIVPRVVSPVAAVRPITRSRINDQVTFCSENLPVATFSGREQRVIQISDELKKLLRVLEESPAPLKAMQAATKAGIKEKKRCNQLLYHLEKEGVVERLGPTWKLCRRPEEEDILAYSSELYVKHEANKTPPVNEANDSASAQQGGLHLHINNQYIQVGDNNVMNVMSQNNFRSGRQSE